MGEQSGDEAGAGVQGMIGADGNLWGGEMR